MKFFEFNADRPRDFLTLKFSGKTLCQLFFITAVLPVLPSLALAQSNSANERSNSAVRAIHIRGSVTFETIVQSLAEQFMRSHPATSVVVSAGGTSRGYLTLLDRTADMAMVSGAPSEDAQDEITRSSVKLINVPFRRVAMAPAVHFSNPINDLSAIQLREIFTGRINNWKSVGGKDAPINVYVGPPGDGITNTWNEKILGDTDTFTPKARNAELQQRITRVGGDPFGITYLATESLKNRELKVLSVDKVLAGADSVLSGRYTLLAPLMFATREKQSPEVQKFLQFVGNLSVPISNSVFALPSTSPTPAPR